MFETLRDGVCQSVDLWAQAGKKREGRGDCQDVIGRRQQALASLEAQRVHPLGTEARTGVASQDVLHTEHIGRVLPHQVRAFAHDSAHRSRSLWVDEPCGQHAQSSHMGQPAGLRMVIRILQAAVWVHRRRVGSGHPGGRRHQPIDEPVPVGGRLHHHALEVGALRGSLL